QQLFLIVMEGSPMFGLRPDVSALKSRFTTTQRILIVTLISLLVLSGVALSTSAALRAKLGLAKASKAETAQQPQVAPRDKRVGADLVRLAGPGSRERAFRAMAPMATTVSATKTDSVFADADNDTQA